jgi:hypothetical protein
LGYIKPAGTAASKAMDAARSANQCFPAEDAFSDALVDRSRDFIECTGDVTGVVVCKAPRAYGLVEKEEGILLEISLFKTTTTVAILIIMLVIITVHYVID